MRFELVVSGGLAHFPGLSGPNLIDSEKLPSEEGAELERLAHAAKLFELASPSGAGRPDTRRYKLKVEDGQQTRELEFVDPIADPNLASLLQLLRKAGRGKAASR